MRRLFHAALLIFISLLPGLTMYSAAQNRPRQDREGDRYRIQDESYGRQGPPPWARAASRNRRDIYSGTIVNEGSGKCLDLKDGRAENGTNIQLWDCTGSDAQNWRIVRLDSDDYLIVSQRTGKAMEVENGGRNVSANIRQWEYTGTAAQRWRIETVERGLVRLVNSNSGLCADVQQFFGRRGSGGNVAQANCGSTRTQLWRVSSDQFGRGDRGDDRGRGTPNGRLRYRGQLESRRSHKCLDIHSPTSGDGAIAQQWDCTRGDNQRWKVIDLGGNEYALQLEISGLVLEVANGNRNNGAPVQQMRWNGSSSQRWRLRNMPGGAYQFVDVNSGKCLDIKGEREYENGARAQIWDCRGGDNQQWIMP